MKFEAWRMDDHVIVRMRAEDVQDLRVALQPCVCREAKSAATADTRRQLVRELGCAVLSKPGGR